MFTVIKRFFSLQRGRTVIGAFADPLRVLIVGAGPAGLSVAHALKQNGIVPDILEREKKIRFDGAGVAIPANGTWALKKLNIDVFSQALKISNMHFTDESERMLVDEQIDRLHPEQQQFYAMTRSDLMEVLLSKLIDTSVPVYTGTTVKKFSENIDEITVEWSNGKKNQYDLMIACDGIRSGVRQLTNPLETPVSLGLFSWRTIIHSFPELKHPIYMIGSDRLLLLYPLPNNQAYIYGHLLESSAQFDETFAYDPECSDSPFSHAQKQEVSALFFKVFSGFKGSAVQAIQKVYDQKKSFHMDYMEKSHSVRFKPNESSRILFLGDAAHACGPMLQNGVAQAFEDAYVMSELVQTCYTSEQVPALTHAFEIRRKQRVQKIFDESNQKIQSISDPITIKERQESMRKNGAPNVLGFKRIFQTNP